MLDAKQRLGQAYPCAICGAPFLKDHSRRVTCSPECQKLACDPVVDVCCAWCDKPMKQEARATRNGHRPACSKTHASALGLYDTGHASCPWSPPKPPSVPKPKPVPFREERECAWCGGVFTARSEPHIFCSKDHKSKAVRVRRSGRQHGWDSHFTLVELMRVFLLFDRRCAYCDQPIVGLPQPDHVVPLSRGGPNSITNIVPCDGMCNSDKRDLLLSEWNGDRERRGLEPRIVSWSDSDPRVKHLTFREVSSVA